MRSHGFVAACLALAALAACGRSAPVETPLVRFDDVLGWATIPGLAVERHVGGRVVEVHTTDDGRRGTITVPRKRQAGRARIVVLGAEATFAADVADDETWPAGLQRALRDTDVLDFAVPGYGTDQMMLRWERDGAGHHPDVVVVEVGTSQVARNLDRGGKPWFEWGERGSLILSGVPLPSRDVTAVPPRPALTSFDERGPGWMLTRSLLERFAFEVHEHGAGFVLLRLETDAPALAPALAQAAREDKGFVVDAGRTMDGPAAHAAVAHAVATAVCANRLVPEAACAATTP